MKRAVLFISVFVVCFGLLALTVFLNMEIFVPHDAAEEIATHDAIQEGFVFATSPIYDDNNDEDKINDTFLTAFPLYGFREDLREVYTEIGHLSEMIVPTDSFLFIMNEGGISTGGFIASDMDIQGFAVLPRSDLWILNNFDRYLMHYLENGAMHELKIIHDIGSGDNARFFFANGNYDLIEASLQETTEDVVPQQIELLMQEERIRGIILDNVAQAVVRGVKYPGLLIRNDSLHRLYQEIDARREAVVVRPLENYPSPAGVYLEIVELEPYSNRVVVNFVNYMNYAISVNEQYKLEFFNGEFWQNVPEDTRTNLPFMAFSLSPQRTMSFIVFLESFPTQDAGLFRVRRAFKIENSNEVYDIVAEFYRP